MKVFLKIPFLLLLSFSLITCISNSPNQTLDNSSGQISLKFNKNTVPENVVTVKATLSKLNHDPIISSLSLLDSNSAELFIDQIPVGQWNLVVEAFDSQNLVVFSGETVLDIVAGEITTVSLTLAPTGNGTGSIYLFVNWGDENKFIDFPVNPVVERLGNNHDPFGIAASHVVKDNDLYYMWYSARAHNGKFVIYLAKSNNGVTWQIHDQGPVLEPGSYGSWDDLSVTMAVVIKDLDIFKMYYTGWRDSYSKWSVGLATSQDGINWEKLPNPILSGNMITNDYKIAATDIVKSDNQYYLYYTGKNDIYDIKIGCATSVDGINWEKQPSPIIEPDQVWEENLIGNPTVIKVNSQFQMIYSNGSISNITGFGIAYSTDGINWVKDLNNPIFTEELTNENYANIGYPYLLYDVNDYKLYYTGWHESNITSINLARKFIY
ncbi:MAG: hypothetical protein HND52_03735 [Ignavibacteriae bacterium]|nr:hypothetical protein [Ignavibacteriota bacterium]NOG97067.1 hypothetical protein [Ignavibacteriota bacterium]